MIKNDKNLNLNDLYKKYNVDEYFSPLKGNVLFCSALDGWGFTIDSMAQIFGEKWGLKGDSDKIKKYFWGEYYFDFKNKKITKTTKNQKTKPIFIQYILNTIFHIY